ncbi:MAG: hypothetical protein EG825_05370 [Rhodocyclaceae bacterium]|nr:hypothetical protein [Rhodocyclaceae bacterium]
MHMRYTVGMNRPSDLAHHICCPECGKVMLDYFVPSPASAAGYVQLRGCEACGVVAPLGAVEEGPSDKAIAPVQYR